MIRFISIKKAIDLMLKGKYKDPFVYVSIDGVAEPNKHKALLFLALILAIILASYLGIFS